MLQALLQRISQGGMVSLPELARELGVSQPLVEAMIADLVRSGYLREGGGAAAGCAGCGARFCRPGRIRFWTPTGPAAGILAGPSDSRMGCVQEVAQRCFK